MRLLTCDDDGIFRFTNDLGDDESEPYAILSHMWGRDIDEVQYHDIGSTDACWKSGYEKIKFCGEQARQDGLRYFWVDTCCIDKSNNTELTRAINSMFEWYRRAQVCYVYLTDVSSQPRIKGYEWQSAFRQSRWFSRGWTLQELLAPREVVFYSKEWHRLGTKIQLKALLQNITGIPSTVLDGQQALSDFTTIGCLQWTYGRQTKEREDQVYCLFGIFDVNMPLVYGERDKAFRRLLKELDGQEQAEHSPELQQSVTIKLTLQQMRNLVNRHGVETVFNPTRQLDQPYGTSRMITQRMKTFPVGDLSQWSKRREPRQDRSRNVCAYKRTNRQRHNTHKGTQAAQIEFTFQMPLWMSWDYLKISCTQVNHPFGFNFQVYNTRSSSCELFQAARQRNWEKVGQMLAKYEGSVFDADELGNTLLHIAASQAQTHVCRYLLSSGADAFREAGKMRQTPLQSLCLAYRQTNAPIPNDYAVMETARLLMPPSPESVAESRKELRSWFHRSSLPAKAASMLTRVICPSYDSIDPLLRAHLALSSTSPDPDFVFTCLGKDLSIKRAFKMVSTPPVSGYGHRQILFTVCRNFARADLTDRYRDGWINILTSIISFEKKSVKPDIKLMYRSLYFDFIANCMSAGKAKGLRAKGMRWNDIMTFMGKDWLETLVTCGADLGRFAAAEKAVFKYPETLNLPKRTGYWICHKVKYFLCGPNIDDWQVFVVPTTYTFGRSERSNKRSIYIEGHEEYEMAGDFWKMAANLDVVENLEEKDDGDKSSEGKPIKLAGPIF